MLVNKEQLTLNISASTGRKVSRIVSGLATSDGAGVRLKRYIGTPVLAYLDPFLLLDEFSSDNPEDYMAGFPPHPHRGMETVTYMVEGKVAHEDSLGNSGIIKKGDAQWMTAGSGIIHSEMPAMENGLLRGLQLWVNLPAKDKMGAPMYRELKSETVPTEVIDGGTVKIIAGHFSGKKGAFPDISGNPMYADVALMPGSIFEVAVPASHNAFAFIVEGEGQFGEEKSHASASQLVVFERSSAEKIIVQTTDSKVRFVLVSGLPLNEPVARGGPFVMNTDQEIQDAWREFSEGTFIKEKAKVL